MTVCKPKIGTLFSLGIFSIGGIAVGGFSFSVSLMEKDVAWYHYLAGLTLFPLAIVLFVRMFWSYKIVEFGKEKVVVKFPFRFQSFSFSIKEIKNWRETRVNTRTGNYRELEINSGSKKVSLSYQEHSNYLDALKYLEKKAAKSKKR